jgi:hypothetical protein
MRNLHQSHHQPAAPAIQPGMPVLRRSDDSDAWHTAHQQLRVCNPQASSADRLASLWARPIGAARAGQTAQPNRSTHPTHAVAYWPGIRFGVRGPTQDETPLSWEEVKHGMAQHVIGDM